MSFGSHSVDGNVILKFDMHTFASTMTVDEVNSMTEQYGIPLDLCPCVPSSTMTMNNLPNWKYRFYFIDCLAVSDAMPWKHHDSRVADLPPSSIRAEDVHRLCEHVIDLRYVHAVMLYVIGLTIMWKHVGVIRPLKMAKGMVTLLISGRLSSPKLSYALLSNLLLLCCFFVLAANMSEFLRFPMAKGVRIGKGTSLRPDEVIKQHTTPPLPAGIPIPDKSGFQKVVEHGDERILAAKEKKKAQQALDKAVGKQDGSPRSGSGTVHSGSPLTTVMPVNENTEAGGSNQALQSDDHIEEEVANAFHNDDNEVESSNSTPSPHSEHSIHSEEHIKIPSSGGGMHMSGGDAHVRTHVVGSRGRVFGSSSGGSGPNTFPSQNSGGNEGGSFRAHMSPLAPFVPS
ncbi:hypothetical protein Tco_0583415 [Tanacetum coccineum]